MSKKKSKTADKPKEYIVLIPVSSNETGEEFRPGDTVTEHDFPAAAIDNWLGIVPPVLKVKEVEEVG